MGRRPKVVIEGTDGAVPVAPVRRRRRSSIVDHAGQGKSLLSSLLKSRGERGATQAEALSVILWARGIHEEAAELKTLSTRVRRAKTQNLAERQIALQLDQVLLDWVISGTLLVDVNEAGGLLFIAV